MNWGPWYIARVTNKHGKSMIIIHTNAEHFVFVHHVLEPTLEWRMTDLLGPFYIQEEAEKIGQLENLNFKSAAQFFNVTHWEFNEFIGPIKVKKLITLKSLRV